MAVVLTLKTPDLSASAAQLYGIAEKAVAAAEVRAINKTLRWLTTHVKRSLAADLGLAQTKIKNRFHMARASKQKTQGKFWLGAYSIALAKFGKGRSVGTGYRVKDRFEQGGFRARMPTGHEGIYSRTTKRRLPIRESKVRIADKASTAIDRFFDRAEAELLKRFKQELNFEMHKAMKNA